jgi:hypothetical protein
MAIKSTVQSRTQTEPKFPKLMHIEDSVYLVTHDQEVGLARTLLLSKSIPERIGRRQVIDDMQLSRMNTYCSALILENSYE